MGMPKMLANDLLTLTNRFFYPYKRSLQVKNPALFAALRFFDVISFSIPLTLLSFLRQLFPDFSVGFAGSDFFP